MRSIILLSATGRARPRRTCARPAASLAPRLAFSKACSQGRDTGLRARLRCHYLEIFNTFWRRASPGLRGQLRPGFPAAARTVCGLAGARPPARGARPCSAAPRARAATESLRLPLSLPPPTQAWDSASKYCSPFLFSAPAPLPGPPWWPSRAPPSLGLGFQRPPPRSLPIQPSGRRECSPSNIVLPGPWVLVGPLVRADGPQRRRDASEPRVPGRTRRVSACSIGNVILFLYLLKPPLEFYFLCRIFS